ncbi:dipeptide/oligopeptide/nickel ABC transporter permease/ATP-binding protein [Azospirillum sp. A29]|jgi:oligopeptide/dipeptide ABC transporter ATP-binding protein|uniref:dipeptide/oligopeptide/nickel ABC transporter permease/ATP-binding protein n=1 Tax=Azospirillum sp. A29 TaxID=3160606 RepID=UPI00366C9200
MTVFSKASPSDVQSSGARPMTRLTNFWSDPRTRRILPSALVLGFLILVAIAGPPLIGFDPLAMDMAGRLAGPSGAHWLGQDEFGRDVLSRLLYGARTSLGVAFATAILAAAVGVAAGLIGGFFGGIAEVLTVRLSEAMLCFPPILLALLVVAFAGPGAGTLIVTLGLFYAPEFARITYGEVRAVQRKEFVEAMRALGAGPVRLMGWTILPNISAPLFVQFALVIASAIVVESGLSFLGLGIVPPTPSWGLMIRGARSYLALNPLGLFWPCLALVATMFTVYSLCDAIRDAFDPRTARAGRTIRFRAVAGGKMAESAPAAIGGNQLRVSDLVTRFATPAGPITAVDGVSISLKPGEIVAVVGESGSGKSVTSLSVMGLLPRPTARIAGGSILLRRHDGSALDMATASSQVIRSVQGNDVAMIFQEPMTSLNPVYRIGDQIVEAVRAHRRCSRSEALALALEMLRKVRINEPERRLKQYPHELSGGMRQRVMIAMALACDPGVLIADEPTTALDVTIQAEILKLIKQLQAERMGGMGVLLITHNMGIVAEVADRVVVMYAGRVVEEATTEELFARPRHPYTCSLMRCIPRPDQAQPENGKRPRLSMIPGSVPSPAAMPAGCKFADRCELAIDACRQSDPALYQVDGSSQKSRCIRWSEL